MNTQVVPITPDDLKTIHIDRIEPEMCEAVNQLIKKNYKQGSAIVKRNDLLDLYMNIKGITEPAAISAEKTRIFENFLFDIEGLYRSVGWTVYWEAPDRGENFEEYFKFTVKKYNNEYSKSSKKR